jgi:outer membrane protein assembly factor BamB
MHSIVRILFACAIAPAAAGADNWPQWRGPGRDGNVPAGALPAALPATLQEVWKVPAGEGYSGPAIAGGKVVVFCRRGEKEVVLGLDARTGKELWKDDWDAPFKPEDYSKVHGKGPFSTPTISGGKVYLQGIAGAVKCYDLASGALVWRKDFAGQYKKPYPMWGAAASPLIEKDLCIVWVGTEGGGALAALHKDSGDVVWKLPELEPSYSSPVAVDLAGARQAVALSRTQLVGIDPAKGKVLWRIDFKAKYEQNIVTPIVRGDLVFMAGYEEPTLSVRIARSGDGFTAEKAWGVETVRFFLSSPIPCGDFLYGVTHGKKGALACIGMADGKVRWMTEGGLGEYASVIASGDRLLVATAGGELLLVAADPAGYKEISRTKGPWSGIWSHIALADGALFLKDKTHIACYALPAK